MHLQGRDSGLPGLLAIFVSVVVVVSWEFFFSFYFPLIHTLKGGECRGRMEMVAVASVWRILAGTCLLTNHLCFVFVSVLTLTKNFFQSVPSPRSYDLSIHKTVQSYPVRLKSVFSKALTLTFLGLSIRKLKRTEINLWIIAEKMLKNSV